MSIYSIRQVIELTGVSEFTLRGWESRYGALQPVRSQTGRRQYSSEDVLKIKLLIDLLAAGYRIGKIAGLDVFALEQLVPQSLSRPKAANVDSSIDMKGVSKIITYASKFDWDEIERIISKAWQRSTPSAFIQNFLLPLISEINHRVDCKQFSIAQEHIMSALIKKFLCIVISQGKKSTKNGPRIVLAAPEGDFHEIGLLIASALLSLRGLRHLYLGPNVPAFDLCEASLKYRASHILISSTISSAHRATDDFFEFVHFVDRHLEPRVELLLAGPNAIAHSIRLKRKHKLIASFAEFGVCF